MTLSIIEHDIDGQEDMIEEIEQMRMIEHLQREGWTLTRGENGERALVKMVLGVEMVLTNKGETDIPASLCDCDTVMLCDDLSVVAEGFCVADASWVANDYFAS